MSNAKGTTMKTVTPIAVFLMLLGLFAWSGDKALAQPRPPGPAPMPRGPAGPGNMPARPAPGRPPNMPNRPPARPVFGPVGSGARPQISNGGPGGIGRLGMNQNLPGRGPSNLPGLGGFGALARSGAFSPGNSPTFPINQQAMGNQANQVRDSFNINYNNNNYFNGNWWGRHDGAWRAAAWAAARDVYRTPAWDASYAYCGYGYSEPVNYYDYGSNVVYERQYVYVNGDQVATQEEYGQQATSIADSGKQAKATQDEDWLALGVYAVVQGEQTGGNDLFQLAVNRSGVIRGNYYNSLSDATLPVAGAVDRKTQRAAWTIADRKEPVFEAGYANLTKPETTMMVHFGPDRAQQWTLVRMDEPAGPR
jgi:hypothetical protein